MELKIYPSGIKQATKRTKNSKKIEIITNLTPKVSGILCKKISLKKNSSILFSPLNEKDR